MLATKLVTRLVLLCGLTVGAASTVPASATVDEAVAFVQTMGDAAIAALADESMSDDDRKAVLARLFAERFDVHTIGLFALGRHRRTLEQNQIDEYIELFQAFIVNTYAARLSGYGGEIMRVQGARADAGGDIMVASHVVRPEGGEVRIDWRVRPKEEGFKVVDVVVEGVSMIITQRDEFASVIRSHGGRLDGLLTALRERTAEH